MARTSVLFETCSLKLCPIGYVWYFDLLRSYVGFAEYLMLPGSRDYLVRRNGKSKARKIIDLEMVHIAKEWREEKKKRGGVAGRIVEDAAAALPEGTDLDDQQWEAIFDQLEAYVSFCFTIY
jgi:hypothetical protein